MRHFTRGLLTQVTCGPFNTEAMSNREDAPSSSSLRGTSQTQEQALHPNMGGNARKPVLRNIAEVWTHALVRHMMDFYANAQRMHQAPPMSQQPSRTVSLNSESRHKGPVQHYHMGKQHVLPPQSLKNIKHL
ncbi:hypothetical protein M758_UG328500 [Ceratodon purpureus]|nr:hypothetical protein M758_UG328500 [Ceratodon purpureus]